MNGGTRRRAVALYFAALVVVGIAANGNGFADLLPTTVESAGTTVPRLTTVPPAVEVAETTTSTSTSTSTTTSSTSTTTTTAAPVTTAARATTPTAPATTAATVARTTVAPQSSSGCDPNYAGACVPIASDVDCAGGSGNGPAYVRAQDFEVVGRDIYDLDRNGDGIACES